MSCFRNQNDKMANLRRDGQQWSLFHLWSSHVKRRGDPRRAPPLPDIVISPLFACATCFIVTTIFSQNSTGHVSYLTMRAFQDMLLGPLKAVLMRVLQQQLSKYIHNIELEELGLMGGDVVLENLGATCRCWQTASEMNASAGWLHPQPQPVDGSI